MDAAGILPYEQVHVVDVTNGARLETYAIKGLRGSGEVCINGAAARHFHPGDKVIIVAFCLTDEPVEPRMIAVDEQNRFAQNLAQSGSREDITTRPDPVEA